MLKAIVITKTAKAIVKEIRKYDLNVAIDKGSSKVIVTLQRKKQGMRFLLYLSLFAFVMLLINIA